MQVKEAEGLAVSGSADLVLGEDRLALHAPDTGHYIISIHIVVTPLPLMWIGRIAQQLLNSSWLCGVNYVHGSMYVVCFVYPLFCVWSQAHNCLGLTKHSNSLCSGGCDLSSSHRPVAGILAHCCSEALWSQQC